MFPSSIRIYKESSKEKNINDYWALSKLSLNPSAFYILNVVFYQ